MRTTGTTFVDCKLPLHQDLGQGVIERAYEVSRHGEIRFISVPLCETNKREPAGQLDLNHYHNRLIFQENKDNLGSEKLQLS